jgi:hypothetical protein
VKRRRLLLVAVALAGSISTFLFVALVPVPQGFSMVGVTIPDLTRACPGIDTTAGTTVGFHWSAPSPIYFFVVSCSANTVTYHSNGTQGSGTFVSIGGVYEFGAGCGEGQCVGADVSGSFTGPLLPL